MQTHVKVNRKVAFFYRVQWDKKVKILLSPILPPLNFCRHSLKLLSPTLPKLMNWILLSLPPLSSDPDYPPKFGTCTSWISFLSNCQKKYFAFLTHIHKLSFFFHHHLINVIFTQLRYLIKGST